jgi:hypothetical protein
MYEDEKSVWPKVFSLARRSKSLHLLSIWGRAFLLLHDKVGSVPCKRQQARQSSLLFLHSSLGSCSLLVFLGSTHEYLLLNHPVVSLAGVPSQYSNLSIAHMLQAALLPVSFCAFGSGNIFQRIKTQALSPRGQEHTRPGTHQAYLMWMKDSGLL